VNVLIIKLGATGDVVRTTPLLSKLDGQVTWLTDARNVPLLQNLGRRFPRNDSGDRAINNVTGLCWAERAQVPDVEFDLVIILEDSLEVGAYLRGLRFRRLFGAFLDAGDSLSYTEESRAWFDLSLISRHGRQQADRLKLLNRRTYQDLIFEGLGFHFNGEEYFLPEPTQTDLAGDVAISPEAGPVWPMKNWAGYAQLKSELEALGLTVNILPRRSTLLEHLSDVRNHRCLVSGDSLPMHFALGTGTPCVSLFTCTSPWEIYEYGLQTKIVSPLLSEFFYQRGFDPRATTAISLDEVIGATKATLDGATAAAGKNPRPHAGLLS
jgi:heptosyltransferase II